MAKKKKIGRALSSLLMTWGFVLLGVTGIILYIVPQGRVAYWTDWRLLGMDKVQWGNIHILSGLMLLVAGGFHVYYNWKPLLAYLQRKRDAARHWPPIVLSVAITLILAVGAAAEVPPVSYVIDLSGAIKDGWVSDPAYEPPFGHAEDVPLRTLCKKTNIPLDAALAKLEADGIEASGKEKVIDIARAHDMSPMELFSHIAELAEPEVIEKTGEKGEGGSGEPALTPEDVEDHFAGSGVGRKTPTQLVEQVGHDLAAARKRMGTLGWEIDFDGAMKANADRYDVTPMELLKGLLIDGYRPDPAATPHR